MTGNDHQKLFLDTNILVDVLSKRAGFYDTSRELLETTYKEGKELVISSLSVVNVHYICKIKDQKILEDFLKLFEIKELSKKTIDTAFALKMKDYEDAVQLANCIESDCEYLITRNKRDFKIARKFIDVCTPEEYLSRISNL